MEIAVVPARAFMAVNLIMLQAIPVAGNHAWGHHGPPIKCGWAILIPNGQNRIFGVSGIS